MIFAKWVLILLALSLLMRCRLNVSLLALVMFYADKLRRIEKKTSNFKHTKIDHAKKKHFRGGIRKSNEIFGKNKASCLKTFV